MAAAILPPAPSINAENDNTENFYSDESSNSDVVSVPNDRNGDYEAYEEFLIQDPNEDKKEGGSMYHFWRMWLLSIEEEEGI